jgi:hypothetical protein
MTDTLWGKFHQTANTFAALVPDAKPVGGTGQYELDVDGVTDTFRLKRGKDTVNQNHIYRGEPLVAHVPQADDEDEAESRWYVLSVSWLISYALENPVSRQHTVHALDCFSFPSSQLTSSHEVEPDELPQAIADAIRESREDNVTRAIRAIRRARVISVAEFEGAADTAANALGLPVPKETTA